MSKIKENIIKLLKSKNPDDIKVGAELLFSNFPEVREFGVSYNEDKMVVYYKNIEHIIKISGTGCLFPEHFMY